MKMRSLAFVAAFSFLAGSVTVAQELHRIYESPAPVTANGELDKIVFAKLASLKIKPVLCSDAVFVRRAYLDVIGTLPTAAETRAFLKNEAPSKRRVLIEQLMERDEYADYWAMKWGDVLRIKAEFPINLWPNAAQAYHRWVRASIVANKPYDQFVREMLTSSGSNFRVGPVNFYRAIQNKTPEGIATAAALTFMGSRTDYWPEGRLEGVSVFFSQVSYKPTSEWKEECVFWDPLKAAETPGNVAPGHAKPTTSGQVIEVDAEDADVPMPNGKPPAAIFPDGTKIQIRPDQDPREVFADWLITPENPWFTKSIANRVCAWTLGRGVVHEPDDIRDGNPPANPKLLAYLEKELIDSKYDLKHLFRLLLTSKTYQLSSLPRHDSPEAVANFASYPLRRLDAEVLIDAINQITGTTDLYTSAIPEPFTYIPRDQSAIAIADGSITSPFLALFGRSARATGMANERNNNPVSAQSLHLLNSSHIQLKLERGGRLKSVFSSRRKPAEIVYELYMTILSRRPTQEELETVGDYVQSTGSRGAAAIDIAWSLINSTEFLYRH